MIIVPAGVKVHLALGHTDMQKELGALVMLIQEQLKKAPFSGHLFVFRGGTRARRREPVVGCFKSNGRFSFETKERPDIATSMPMHASRHLSLARPKASIRP
ncbi:IS66 family insertion sequence element accessory protein TnpB [Mesorhizobium sp. B292B1B]|uniref:IS66 family insertion sequence element accessory protein TnpB n=1 Tax=unclassified Mesorhizobium TaxID=325217 RepID=UPI0011284C12|nr:MULTISPECIES: IS66 family insertion sequence element accessory protein TnpB [unclassified Mesorhizobium]MCA0012141.1 IS66 family insertion sequence element accessory protein TnpB [Mesorhizobium sp. B294B1A1]MCA0038395.1 IS66 family insertion sequence element accessory protein TnpB [Mesorhizobium sp. B292B1B]TPM41216.1 transposase [Mesorhizobium sp. B2-3-2]